MCRRLTGKGAGEKRRHIQGNSLVCLWVFHVPNFVVQKITN